MDLSSLIVLFCLLSQFFSKWEFMTLAKFYSQFFFSILWNVLVIYLEGSQSDKLILIYLEGALK